MYGNIANLLSQRVFRSICMKAMYMYTKIGMFVSLS